jgi:hypothetical protein
MWTTKTNSIEIHIVAPEVKHVDAHTKLPHYAFMSSTQCKESTKFRSYLQENTPYQRYKDWPDILLFLRTSRNQLIQT